MPIMAPLADFAGVPSYLVVTAYQAANGLVNLVTPTSAVVMGGLAIARVGYGVWWRFVWPVLALLFVLSMLARAVGVLGQAAACGSNALNRAQTGDHLGAEQSSDSDKPLRRRCKMAFNLRNRSFVKLLDFTPAEIKFLLKLSADLKAAKYGGYECRASRARTSP